MASSSPARSAQGLPGSPGSPATSELRILAAELEQAEREARQYGLSAAAVRISGMISAARRASAPRAPSSSRVPLPHHWARPAPPCRPLRPVAGPAGSAPDPAPVADQAAPALPIALVAAAGAADADDAARAARAAEVAAAAERLRNQARLRNQRERRQQARRRRLRHGVWKVISKQRTGGWRTEQMGRLADHAARKITDVEEITHLREWVPGPQNPNQRKMWQARRIVKTTETIVASSSGQWQELRFSNLSHRHQAIALS